ncbi:hypothetical protein VKT23_014626 [Stygiomarasmius scandens]|uniref:Peptidase C1A papain C-terminal domain-containing protein n=1 Tax=Marasmiellus scandens TaxID=2682957 RepID=A0ABR1J342_9AGAR
MHHQNDYDYDSGSGDSSENESQTLNRENQANSYYGSGDSDSEEVQNCDLEDFSNECAETEDEDPDSYDSDRDYPQVGNEWEESEETSDEDDSDHNSSDGSDYDSRDDSQTEEDSCGCGSSRHGHIPDPPDHRDIYFEPDADIPRPHDGIDLRDHNFPVYSQGKMMSCTAHAVAAAFEFDVRRQNLTDLTDFSPSRLFIWYHARQKLSDHDAVLKNCGTNIRDAIKSLDPKVHGYGVCSEEDWSYEIAESNPKTHYFRKAKGVLAKAARRPPKPAYQQALHHKAVKYYSFNGQGKILLNKLINCLDQHYPFVFAMNTYGLLGARSVRKTGIFNMPVPNKIKNKPKESHAVMAVGYDPEKKRFIIRNSWGTGFGDHGHFTMPYEYALKHCYGFWTIRLVSSIPSRG